MYKNIGGKIKTLSKAVCWLGIIASVVLGVITIVSAVTSGEAIIVPIVTGAAYIIIGSIASWIASFFTYGFGEIIDKLSEIANNTKK